MTESPSIAEMLALIKSGLRSIGYRDDLLRDNYIFADILAPDAPNRQVQLAAFAQDPPSYVTACFGIAVLEHGGPGAIQSYTALGAPQVFSLDPVSDEVRLWKISADHEPQLLESIESSQVHGTILQHGDDWNPQQVLRGKSISFTSEPLQLDLFDAGLVPTLEDKLYEKLDILLRGVLASCKAVYYERQLQDIDYRELFRLIFRFITAKLLADRGHPGAWNSNDPKEVIEEVNRFYFRSSQAEPVLQDVAVQRIAWDKIREAFSFQNVSVEAIANIYENTLVTDELREQYDIHATPPEVAKFIVENLPFESLALEDRRIFEPFAGHAPFLVAGLHRLKALLPLDMPASQRHSYLVRMLIGMEIDSFAREAALYSLNTADYPNPNGWQVSNVDFFSSPATNIYLDQASVVLCNPPFRKFTSEEKKANATLIAPDHPTETLRRILLHKPKMMGLVLPRVFINGQSYEGIRRHLASLYDEIKIVSLPDVAFRHSDIETVLLTAFGDRSQRPRRTSAIVSKLDYPTFLRTGQPSWTRELAPTAQEDLKSPALWTDPLSALWAALKPLPTLATFAEIHRGIEYNIPVRGNEWLLFSDKPRTGFSPGLVSTSDNFEPYHIESFRFLNIDRTLMRREAYKLDWGRPKVIVNASRLATDRWIMAGALDQRGLVCYQRFHGVWSTGSLPLEVIAAIMNGPVSNAYASAHLTSRDIQVRTLRSLPIPNFQREHIDTIVSLVRQYDFYRGQWLMNEFGTGDLEQTYWRIAQRIDQIVLEAYNLPPELRELLDSYFDGYYRSRPESARHFSREPMRVTSLYGLWADLGTAPTAEEINEMRRENAAFLLREGNE